MKRWQLIFYLRVFDRETERQLGHIVDITTEGMMLISDQPIPLNTDFKLWIDVPQDDDQRERIYLDAHSLWSSKDVNPDFYDTGFRLQRLTPDRLEDIQILIGEFGINAR
ncbi:MAG: PilZ domain-containing protein [Candidatus Competibacterales bacterium]|nr:PilZ domain-containing protein [Candidatus Competibacterales bacterium]